MFDRVRVFFYESYDGFSIVLWDVFCLVFQPFLLDLFFTQHLLFIQRLFIVLLAHHLLLAELLFFNFLRLQLLRLFIIILLLG